MNEHQAAAFQQGVADGRAQGKARISALIEKASAGGCADEVLAMLQKDVKLETVEEMADLLTRAKAADCKADLMAMHKHGAKLRDIEEVCATFEYLKSAHGKEALRDTLRRRTLSVHDACEFTRSKYQPDGKMVPHRAPRGY